MPTTITVQTRQKTEVIDITDQLAPLVAEVADGLAFFSVPHTTAALIINEDEQALRMDFVKAAERLLSPLQPFRHDGNGGNAQAHVMSAFFGTSVTVAVENGQFDLGRWQRILLIELDGPRRCEVRCKLIG